MRNFAEEKQDVIRQIDQAESDVKQINNHIFNLKKKLTNLEFEEVCYKEMKPSSNIIGNLPDLSSEFSSELLVYDKSKINTGRRMEHGGNRKRAEEMKELSKMVEGYIRERGGMVKLEFINKQLEKNGVWLANPTTFMRSMIVHNRNIVKKARGYYGLSYRV